MRKRRYEPESARDPAHEDSAAEQRDLIDRPMFDSMHPLHEVGMTLGSVAACAAVLAELFMAMLILTMIAPLVAATLDRFEAPTPSLTSWVLSLSPMVTFFVLLGLMIAVAAKEWLMDNKRLTLIINLVFLAASILWIPLLISALFRAPWAELIHSFE